jgi:hypothetical protein
LHPFHCAYYARKASSICPSLKEKGYTGTRDDARTDAEGQTTNSLDKREDLFHPIFLWATLRHSQQPGFRASNDRTCVNDELERFRGERSWPNPSTIPEFCLQELMKPPKTSVRISGVLTAIRTEHLPKTNAERYHYANPFGLVIL